MMILPTPLESLFLALKALKRGVEDGTVTNYGICDNVYVQVEATLHSFIDSRAEHLHQLGSLHHAVQAHLIRMFKSLGLDTDFPVPSPDPSLSAEEIFGTPAVPKWTGEYGAARRALLDQLIEMCGKLLAAVRDFRATLENRDDSAHAA